MPSTLSWVGAAILLILAGISAYRLATQKTITRNLLLLVVATTVGAFVLLGLVPAVVKVSGLEMQLRERTEALADEKESAGISGAALKRRVALNGRDIFMTENQFESLKSVENRIVNPKFLFSIAKPSASSGLAYSELSVEQYARALGASPDDIESLTHFSLLRDANVFRIASKQAVSVRVSNYTTKGELATPEEYRNAWKFYVGSEAGEPPNNAALAATISDLRKGLVSSVAEDDIDNPAVKPPVKWIETVRFASDITIIAFDRKKFEMTLMAANGGRKVPATPLSFLLAAGGTLPRFDPFDVVAADVSEDNNIWAFYSQVKLNNVEVNGNVVPAFFQEMYRFYVLNSAYVYQITVLLIRTPEQPPQTWDEILKTLQSLRIVDAPQAA
ncbi:MAG: hypothetical protein ACXW5U_28610 [Thermoanaerobaculia bacterium]